MTFSSITWLWIKKEKKKGWLGKQQLLCDQKEKTKNIEISPLRQLTLSEEPVAADAKRYINDNSVMGYG